MSGAGDEPAGHPPAMYASTWIDMRPPRTDASASAHARARVQNPTVPVGRAFVRRAGTGWCAQRRVSASAGRGSRTRGWARAILSRARTTTPGRSGSGWSGPRWSCPVGQQRTADRNPSSRPECPMVGRRRPRSAGPPARTARSAGSARSGDVVEHLLDGVRRRARHRRTGPGPSGRRRSRSRPAAGAAGRGHDRGERHDRALGQVDGWASWRRSRSDSRGRRGPGVVLARLVERAVEPERHEEAVADESASAASPTRSASMPRTR